MWKSLDTGSLCAVHRTCTPAQVWVEGTPELRVITFILCSPYEELWGYFLLDTAFIQLFWQYKPTLMLGEKSKILPSPCWSGPSTHTSFPDSSEQLYWLLSILQHVIVDFSAPHFIFWLYICASLTTLLCPTVLGRIRLTNNAVHQRFYKKKKYLCFI